jgi:DUF177 domain-containing protein
MHEPDTRLWPDHGATGVESGARAAGGSELGATPRSIARLLQDFAADGRDLVAADDHGVRAACRDGLRLGDGESQRAIGWQLSGDGILGRLRGQRAEGEPQALEEGAAVGGRRGENELGHGLHQVEKSPARNKDLTHAAIFDLPIDDTYYTRPMSPPWSQPLDVDRLSRGEAEIDFDVPLAELSRLRSRVPGIGGSVRGTARFGRQSRFAVADLSLAGKALLQCQRCMQTMELAIDSTSHLALIAAEADAAEVPEELEPVLARDGRTSAGELVEEELLLALPIVPLHEEPRDCAVPPSAPLISGEAPEHVSQRPFEGLADLLRRK